MIDAEEAGMRRLRRAWRVSGLAVLFVSATLTLGLMSATAGLCPLRTTGVAPNSNRRSA